jgi:glycosyltransferase involved in cell wall biosynthesis
MSETGMRLLFVLPIFPFPSRDGGRAKIINILRYLSTAHKCDLVCFGDSDLADISGLRQHIPSIGKVWIVPPPTWTARFFRTITNLMCLQPPSFARYSSPEMYKRIEYLKKTGKYDAIHFDIINMAPYQRNCLELPSIHSPNDATSLVYRRLANNNLSLVSRLRLRAVSLLIQRYERKHYANFSNIHVVSQIDRDYLTSLVPKAKITVVPITSGYVQNISALYPLKNNSVPTSLLICGNFSDAAISDGFWEFMDQTMPVIHDAYPELLVHVLGRSNSATLVTKLKKYPKVKYYTWVDNFEEFLSSFDVLLLPDKAGAAGAKTRTVQAMAMGRVVIGSKTAFEGIPIDNLTHGAIYRNQKECQELLLLFLGNPELRKAIGAAAAKLADDEYSMKSIGRKYEMMYLETIKIHATT